MGGCDGDLLFEKIDCLDLGAQMADADRIEHLGERDSDVGDVDLVIPDPDVVIRVTVDNQYLDRACDGADLVKFARRADRSPQPGESSTEHKDACHVSPASRAAWMGRASALFALRFR
jgi:hypothetical protein